MLFSRLKCQLKRKKIDTSSLERFSKFQPAKEWVNKVNLSSFELENFFKFVLAWLAREKQNILTPQQCLHTLLQTLLSANQSARTILVILWSVIAVPAKCITDDDCVKGEAVCLRGECHCTNPLARGDGRLICDSYREYIVIGIKVFKQAFRLRERGFKIAKRRRGKMKGK